MAIAVLAGFNQKDYLVSGFKWTSGMLSTLTPFEAWEDEIRFQNIRLFRDFCQMFAICSNTGHLQMWGCRLKVSKTECKDFARLF